MTLHRRRQPESYESPGLIASYSIAKLRADAATCTPYPSDSDLKTEIETVEQPLARLRRIETS